MKHAALLVLGIVLVFIAGVAHAGQETGPYIGGSLGYADLDVSSGPVDFDDDDFGWKVFAGYNFGIIPLLDLAVEGSYVDFGEASADGPANQDVDITGWDLFGLAALNLGPVGIFGKVGQIWWNSDSDIALIDDTGSDMAYGVGLRFQIGSIGIRGEYEYFDLDNADVGMFSAGVSWTF